MLDDYGPEPTDTPCPHCKAHTTYTRECYANCEDGSFDGYEDDPLWFQPGERETCRECRGMGYLHWCKACGYDFNFKRVIASGVGASAEKGEKGNG